MKWGRGGNETCRRWQMMVWDGRASRKRQMTIIAGVMTMGLRLALFPLTLAHLLWPVCEISSKGRFNLHSKKAGSLARA